MLFLFNDSKAIRETIKTFGGIPTFWFQACYLSALFQKGLSEHKNNKDSNLQKICQMVIMLIIETAVR